jgi:AcrR family transcriptional regulator
MAAADRRRAILDAVVPLLLEKGPAVTTAEMAQAANIAEGTIFRVFPDKPAILFEAIKAAVDPVPIAAALRAIDTSWPLRRQLAAAARVLLEYFNRMMMLGESLRSVSTAQPDRQRDVSRLVKESAAMISTALVELFERHHGALRVSPSEATAAFRGLVFASCHPLLPPSERLAVDAALSILLSGVAKSGRA